MCRFSSFCPVLVSHVDKRDKVAAAWVGQSMVSKVPRGEEGGWRGPTSEREGSLPASKLTGFRQNFQLHPPPPIFLWRYMNNIVPSQEESSSVPISSSPAAFFSSLQINLFRPSFSATICDLVLPSWGFAMSYNIVVLQGINHSRLQFKRIEMEAANSSWCHL